MTAHRVRYEGPKALAVKAATLLADTDGVQLTSAGTPEPPGTHAGEVGLTLTVEGRPDAVQAAVKRIRAQLPDDVRLTIV